MRELQKANQHPANGPKAQGMVLVTTLIAMLLITLMGVVVITVCRTELLVVNNSHQAQMSLGDADSVANIISCGLIEAVVKSRLEGDVKRNGSDASRLEISWGFFQPEDLLATTDYYTVRHRYRLLAQVDGSEKYPIPFIVLKNRQTGKIKAKALVFNDYAAMTKDFSGQGYGAAMYRELRRVLPMAAIPLKPGLKNVFSISLPWGTRLTEKMRMKSNSD